MEITILKYSQILNDRENPRKNIEDIDELADSIELNGQKMPIKVFLDKKTGKYIVLEGNRRYLAFSKIAKKNKTDPDIMCIIQDVNGKLDKVTQQAIMEHQQRSWSVPERDSAWEQLYASGQYTDKELQKLLGANSKDISDFHDRRNLSPELKKLGVNAGILQETKSRFETEDIREMVIRFAHKRGIGAMALRHEVRELKDAPEDIIKAFCDKEIDIEEVKDLKKVKDEETRAEIIQSVSEVKKAAKEMVDIVPKDKKEKSKANKNDIKLQDFQDAVTGGMEDVIKKTTFLKHLLEAELKSNTIADMPKQTIGLIVATLKTIRDSNSKLNETIGKSLKSWEG